MKKKALLASAVALVTASAMTFAPVSYKVIDKVSAAPAETQSDKEVVAGKLQAIADQLTSDSVLENSYNTMISRVSGDFSAALDISAALPRLASALTSNSISISGVETALEGIVDQLAIDYHTSSPNFSSNLGDISQDLEDALEDLQTALGASVTFDRDDLAALLVSVEEQLLELVDGISYTNSDALKTMLKDALLNAFKAEWEKDAAAQNAIVAAFVGLYEDATGFTPVAGEQPSYTAFKADLNSLQAAFDTHIDGLANAEEVKEDYKEGILALAISYAKYYLQDVKQPLLPSYSGNSIILYPDLLGVSGLPLSALDWSTSGMSSATIGVNSDGNLVLNAPATGQVTVTATLKNALNLPATFVGVELFSQQISVSQFTGGQVEAPAPSLSLVSDYEAKAKEIESKLADYVAENPVLSNNTLVYNLVKQLEAQLREALLVQAAGAVTAINGVSVLNVTPEQMTNIYNTQLTAVQKALEDALKAQNVNVNPSVIMTYNIGATSNAEVNLTKAIIDSLISKGIDVVGVKSGDLTIEAALDQLDAPSKVTVKKSAATVAGAKSDVYSLAITSNGKDLVGFEKQYRVTLPVSGNATNVTVAQLANGSQTLVGGKYDPVTKTITFYTNVLGDFVVVENNTSFNDIANLPWANSKIDKLADLGILQGKGNGVFDPRGNVTRAEFTAMLTRTLNLNASVPNTFNDVSDNSWYSGAVAAAKAYGIVNGRSASSFDPNAAITREEMASMASNALKKILNFQTPANADDILGSFVDGNGIAAVHRNNVALLANEGIVQGKGKDNYDPKGTATRAEVAVIMAGIYDIR